MFRIVSAFVCVLSLVTAAGCAGSDPSDRFSPAGDPPSENLGTTSQAIGAPWDATLSSRDQGNDNVALQINAPIGRPSVVPDGAAGFCWVTRISGTFRGSSEYAKIIANSSGYYQAVVKSTTAYDGVPNVGPALSIRCRRLTDFVTSSPVSDFASRGWSASGNATSGSGNYGTAVTAIDSNSLWPWAGVEGRLGPAGSVLWMNSRGERSIDTLYARWATSCPLSSPAFCSMMSMTWETYSSNHTWTYSVRNASAANNTDLALVAAGGSECFVDGTYGEWSPTTAAFVQIESDNKWHLVTQRGSSQTGMGAYAACIPYSQGF